jgi:predicted RNase H-like nuclease (RuvC/YqgF family)
MDLGGKILSVKSYKEIPRAEIINHIIKFGKTVIISTDVSPPPKMVKKLAASLNAKLDYPQRDMSVGSKMGLVETFLDEKRSEEKSKTINPELIPHDAHQRDALASSIRTYNSYRKKLEQIDTRASEINLNPEQADLIKKMFINGRAISTAIKIVQDMEKSPYKDEASPDVEDDKKETKKVDITESKLKNRIKMQENQINNLKNKNKSLEKEIENLSRENEKLSEKIDRLHFNYSQNILQERELLSKISLIKKLQDKYNKEKKLRVELEENLNSLENIQNQTLTNKSLPVKIIENFTREGILKACEYWKIKRGDVVLLSSSEGGGSQTAQQLIKMGVKAVLIRDKISHHAQKEFEKNLVPLLHAESMEVKMIDQFALINALNLEKEILNWKDRIESRQIQESNEEILKVFEEYRARRKRSAD